MQAIQLERRWKKIILAIADIICCVAASWIAHLLIRRYVNVVGAYWLKSTAIYVGVFLISATLLKAYARINRYFGTREMLDILFAHGVAFVVTTLASFLIFKRHSARYLFLFFFFAGIFSVLIRFAWRFYNEERLAAKTSRLPVNAERVLLVGAGEGGHIFLERFRSKRFHAVGFVDEDKDKFRTFLNQVPVIGSVEDIPEICKTYDVQMIIITAPSMPASAKERVVELANRVDVPVRQMPVVEEALIRRVGPEVEEIKIEDLLGREEVKLNPGPPKAQISGKTVLVTGAGGSIGSEICRQLLPFHPARLLLVGHGENSIYQIDRKLKGYMTGDMEIVPLIADVRDRDRMFEIMETYQPDIIYHAAAHKHVPLMEYNPREAVKNNVLGTRNVADAAIANGVKVFVMISTDKANNPPNVMGATKRIAEMMLMGLSEREGSTIFTAVRFGNVLGSQGSVVPLFEEQISHGGPVTVTDERMLRYFMSIPEASRLVIQAGSLAKGGEIFILDMGEPVKIVDLARKMIKLSGHDEQEIPIVFSGIRPGEKLYEELLLTDETTGEKVDDKIYVGKIHNKSLEEIEAFVASLSEVTSDVTYKRRLVDFVRRTPSQS